MCEFLPKITAYIDIDAQTFFERVESIANDIGKFHIERPEFPISGIQAIDLWLYYDETQKRICVRFFHTTTKSNEIDVRVTAAKWSPEQPTYKSYVRAFREALCDFSERYEKRFGKRLEFKIAPQSQ